MKHLNELINTYKDKSVIIKKNYYPFVLNVFLNQTLVSKKKSEFKKKEFTIKSK